jgi:hypothetical protein
MTATPTSLIWFRPPVTDEENILQYRSTERAARVPGKQRSRACAAGCEGGTGLLESGFRRSKLTEGSIRFFCQLLHGLEELR